MCFQNVHVEMRKILNGVFKIYQIHPKIKILFKISTYSRDSRMEILLRPQNLPLK